MFRLYCGLEPGIERERESCGNAIIVNATNIYCTIETSRRARDACKNTRSTWLQMQVHRTQLMCNLIALYFTIFLLCHTIISKYHFCLHRWASVCIGLLFILAFCTCSLPHRSWYAICLSVWLNRHRHKMSNRIFSAHKKAASEAIVEQTKVQTQTHRRYTDKCTILLTLILSTRCIV